MCSKRFEQLLLPVLALMCLDMKFPFISHYCKNEVTEITLSTMIFYHIFHFLFCLKAIAIQK